MAHDDYIFGVVELLNTALNHNVIMPPRYANLQTFIITCLDFRVSLSCHFKRIEIIFPAFSRPPSSPMGI